MSIQQIKSGVIADDAVTNAKLSLAANAGAIKTALNASGDAGIFACRAFVNFNGTGTVAIRASGNVSTVTDVGTGRYTVNFTTAMPGANYSLLGTTEGDTRVVSISGVTTSGGGVRTTNSAGALEDRSEICVAIFR